METPLIDIIIPNRNKARFLPATLASLAAQTETRWRALVIDGESSDGSWEILRAAAALDPRITLRNARPPSTTGLSFYRAWNQGLLQVRAPCFAILTSDDLWEPEWLGRALRTLDQKPEVIAVAARAFLIDVDGKITGRTPACSQLESSFDLRGSGVRTLESRACSLRGLMQGPMFSSIHSMVFRRHVLEEGGLFAEDVGIAADIEYYLHTSLLGDIAYDLDSRAFFRLYPEQASGRTAGGPGTGSWRKIVRRNERYVSARLGIPFADVAAATSDILQRHAFLMTKPDRATFHRSKLVASWRSLQALVRSPRLFFAYLRCGLDFERFFTARVGHLTAALAARIQPQPNAPVARPLPAPAVVPL